MARPRPMARKAGISKGRIRSKGGKVSKCK